MAGMIDSHARISGNNLSDNWQEAAARAKKDGMERVMLVCRGAQEAKNAITMASKDSMFDVALGYWPNDTLKVGAYEWKQLEELVKNPYVKAVGDIGMDYFYYETIVPKVLQKELFIKQMELANEIGKPVLIHMRMAAEDTRRYIKGHLKVPGIMHNYSGGYEKMEDFLEIGMYLSFSGRVVLEASDESVRRAVKEVPLDRLLVESDTLFSADGDLKQENQYSGHLIQVLDYICGLRAMDREILIQAVHNNYMRLFPS